MPARPARPRLLAVDDSRQRAGHPGPLVLPGNNVAAPCTRSSQIQRGEVTLSSEAMAAMQFAASKRVMTVGWDESTKFLNSVFAIYCQLEMFDGSITEVCLRGLTVLPEGGTSAAILAHIELNIFAYSRQILIYWKEEYEKENGPGSWVAAELPDPENIGLHRLCEDTVLQTDTCHAEPAAPSACAHADPNRAVAGCHLIFACRLRFTFARHVAGWLRQS